MSETQGTASSASVPTAVEELDRLVAQRVREIADQLAASIYQPPAWTWKERTLDDIIGSPLEPTTLRIEGPQPPTYEQHVLGRIGEFEQKLQDLGNIVRNNGQELMRQLEHLAGRIEATDDRLDDGEQRAIMVGDFVARIKRMDEQIERLELARPADHEDLNATIDELRAKIDAEARLFNHAFNELTERIALLELNVHHHNEPPLADPHGQVNK